MTAGHDHGAEDLSDARLVGAVAVNVLLTVAQVIGGAISGSLSLIADALHNLNDAASLGIALIARRIARRPADDLRTFGYRRAEVIGALINLTTLILVGLYLIYEAIARFFERPEIAGWTVVIVAAVALGVDLITAALTYAGSRRSLNIKAAFVHNVSDALGSVAVIVAGTLIILYDWYVADLIATLAIAGYVLYQGLTMIGPTIHILMEGVPPDFDMEALVADLTSLDRVQGVHHVHAWQLGEEHRALEAHVIVEAADLEHLERIKCAIKDRLAEHYHITHSTLEIELPEELCRTTTHHLPTDAHSTKPADGPR